MKSSMEVNLSKPSILIDSNVFIGFYNKDDVHHTQCYDLLASLGQDVKIFNHFIYEEIMTVLLQRTKDLSLLRKIEDDFQGVGSQIKIQTISKELLDRTKKLFFHQSSTKLSFADCSLVAQAQIEHIGIIASFDKKLRNTFEKDIQFVPKRIHPDLDVAENIDKKFLPIIAKNLALVRKETEEN